MFTNPNADPSSGYEKKTPRVVVDADTIFDSSAKEDLKVGRDVQMVGVDLRNGTTRATRVVVYEGDRPVPMGNGKVMPVTGPPKRASFLLTDCRVTCQVNKCKSTCDR
jgi:hypothetical protein